MFLLYSRVFVFLPHRPWRFSFLRISILDSLLLLTVQRIASTSRASFVATACLSHDLQVSSMICLSLPRIAWHHRWYLFSRPCEFGMSSWSSSLSSSSSSSLLLLPSYGAFPMLLISPTASLSRLHLQSSSHRQSSVVRWAFLLRERAVYVVRMFHEFVVARAWHLCCSNVSRVRDKEKTMYYTVS